SSPAFRSQEHEKAWLIRTAIRQCLDFNRSACRRRTLPLDADVRTAFPPETGVVLEAVRQLPELDRYIVYLHYYEGYPIKQIGNLLELPEGTVSSRMSRARKKLKEILKGEGYGTVSECL
ncbi:MAG: sigma-70 family RNA polymerase sigma factor, partial [Clostridia bacterium]|nr:sigma-70 family RNA polymerase sigma factor [Clostridia bacterium]